MSGDHCLLSGRKDTVQTRCIVHKSSRLTFLKRGEGDLEALQGFSVQLAFGLDLSCGIIDLQPALSVTVQLYSAWHTTKITLKNTHQQNSELNLRDTRPLNCGLRGDVGSQNKSIVCLGPRDGANR